MKVLMEFETEELTAIANSLRVSLGSISGREVDIYGKITGKIAMATVQMRR